MSELRLDKNRRVIPRWRSFDATLRAGELACANPLAEPRPIRLEEVESHRREWMENPSASFAADFVSSAVALGVGHEARDAARFLMSVGDLVPSPAIALARRVLEIENAAPERLEVPPKLEDEQTAARRQIHEVRQRIHDEPRNAFLRVEVARQYAILGLSERASRSLEIALRLAPTNRFVLRSACRFYVHLGATRRAHDLIRKNERTPYDPWLIAAEIAAAGAADRSPRTVKSARAMLDADRFAPLHLSEVASAVGTLQLEGGNSRSGRKSIARSLISPTENAVAQAAWAARYFDAVEVDGSILRSSQEAKAWESRRVSNWRRALLGAEGWLADEPFSTQPAVFGSYIAGVAVGDYAASERFARYGLLANPADPTLKNNLAFALAQQGNAQEAASVLGSVHADVLSVPVRVAFLATAGLIEFRLGRVDSGRLMYTRALDAARLAGDARRLAVATMYFAIEEGRAGGTAGSALVQQAERYAHHVTDPELQPLLSRARGLAEPGASSRDAPQPTPTSRPEKAS